VSYLPLGSKVTTAAAGGTQSLSPGNWINSFDVAKLAIRVATYECYHIAVTGAPVGKTLTVYIGARIWDSVPLAGNSGWDPAQPMLLTPADEVFFVWNQAATGTAPVVTMWLRWDPAVQPAPIGGS
jgi:hypothetical protein